jgi:uncharacterized protein YigE (DUF2233 family)
MKVNKYRIALIFAISIIYFILVSSEGTSEDTRFHSAIVDAKTENLQFYWKGSNDKPLQTFAQLKAHLETKSQKLTFAMNGGMYKPDHSPQGLYVEKGNTLAPIDTSSGKGNFYLKPNGIFLIREDGSASVCPTPEYPSDAEVKFATQSGPLLLVHGNIHPAFRKGSTNLNIRNGVGILPDGKVLFAMSKEEVNFFDFATFFLEKGCKDALYLDGFVSRLYAPSLGVEQLEGRFGVMIGVSVPE